MDQIDGNLKQAHVLWVGPHTSPDDYKIPRLLGQLLLNPINGGFEGHILCIQEAVGDLFVAIFRSLPSAGPSPAARQAR